MSAVQNFIGDNSSLFKTGIGSWISSNSTLTNLADPTETHVGTNILNVRRTTNNYLNLLGKSGIVSSGYRTSTYAPSVSGAASVSPTTEFDIRIRYVRTGSSANASFFGKGGLSSNLVIAGVSDLSFGLYISNSGIFTLYLSDTGSGSTAASCTTASGNWGKITTGSAIWIRACFRKSDGLAQISYSYEDNPTSSSWIVVPITGGASTADLQNITLYQGNTPIHVGNRYTNDQASLVGKVLNFEVRTTINGPIVAKLDTDNTSVSSTAAANWPITSTTTQGSYTWISSNSASAFPVRYDHDISLRVNDELEGVNSEQFHKGWPLRFFANLYSPSASGKVVLYLTGSTGGSATSASAFSASATVQANEWTHVELETPALPKSVDTFDLQIYGVDLPYGSDIYVFHPTLMSPMAISESIAARETWIRLPEYLRDADLLQEKPNLPLLRFIDVLTALADDVDKTWQGFYWTPPEKNKGAIGTSTLVSPSVAGFAALYWLCQLVGSPVVGFATGTTPWINFDADGVLVSGDSNNTWIEWGNLDGTNDESINWQTLENKKPAETDVAFLRWQISSAAYGFRAGSQESIIAAAKQGLKNLADGDTPVVTVSRDISDPFKLVVNILASQGSQGDVAAAIAPCLPAGFEASVIAS